MIHKQNIMSENINCCFSTDLDNSCLSLNTDNCVHCVTPEPITAFVFCIELTLYPLEIQMTKSHKVESVRFQKNDNF